MAPIVDDDDDEGVVPDAGAEPGTEAKPEGAAGAAPDLMKDVFGDDDDSDDDDAPAAKKKAKAPKAEVDSDADDESEDEISVGRRSRKSKKAPSKRASRRSEKGGKSKDVSAKEKERWDKLQGGKDADSGDEDDTEPARTAEDDAFIDDADVAPEDRYGDDDDERSPVASEAEEEDDDLEKLFGSKSSGRGRARQSEQALTSEALNFLARMEVAAEQDRESVLEKKPAVHKLRMLKEMTEKLKEVDLHEAFLRHGLLKVLASWLSLLPDHNLPNTTVRTAVIDAVRLLPVETDLTDRKEELKRSGLGRIVMFLSTLPEETPANRKKCKDLVEKWSRPVYELSSQYRDLRQEVEDDPDDPPRKKSKKAKPPNAGAATEDRDVGKTGADGPKYGEKGYRYHAVVPEPEAMDYKVRPKLKIDPSEIKARTQNADQHKIRKLLGKSAKARGVKDGKAYLPSIEGRGMVTYH